MGFDETIRRCMDLAREASAVGNCFSMLMLNITNCFNLTKWGWIKDSPANLGVPG